MTPRPEFGSGITIVLGRARSGKSTWAGKAISRYRGEVIVWDPKAEFDELAGRWDFAGDVRSFLRRRATGKRLKRVRVWGSEPDFETLCTWLRAACRAGENPKRVFVVDEAHLVVTPNLRRTSAYAELVMLHRRWNLDLVVISWRPYALATALRSSCETLVLFSMIEARSLKWVEEQCGSELSSKLPKLAVGDKAGARTLIWTP